MRLRGLVGLASATAALALLTACGGGSDTLHITNESLGVTGGHGTVGELTITHAYIPAPATPSLAAAYFTVTNSGATPDRLLSAASTGFRRASLHRYATTGDGTERMVLVPTGVDVPAHGRLTLTPGSYHLMLERPTAKVRNGGVERLQLRFADAGTITITVPVVGATGLPGTAAGVDQMPGMSMGSSAGPRGPPEAALRPLTTSRFFSSWSLHPWSALVAALLLAGYLVGWRAARRRGAAWPHRAVAAWLGGVALLVFATQGSLRVYDDALFWLHMVGHLTLVMLVPILLVAGRPLDLALAAVPAPSSQRIEQVLHGRLCALVTHPGVGIACYTAVIVGTHLTGFMNASMLHPWLTGLEQAMYVIAGVLFFLPLIGNAPVRWQLSAPIRMAVLVVAMPVDTFTGVILGQTDSYPWPAMAAMHPAWAPSLLTDLHAGGAIMWVGGDAIMAVMFGVAAVTWARAAMAGGGSDLGGWLESARANYQQDLVGTGDAPDSSAADPDSDEALDAYNAHLRRLSSRNR
jgi:putative copper resistance protein D